MRSKATYRGYRRNVCRRRRAFADWRKGGPAQAANDRAHLGERARLCSHAREKAMTAYAGAIMLGLGKRDAFQNAAEALRTFWGANGIKGHGRLHYRILKDIGPAPKAAQ